MKKIEIEKSIIPLKIMDDMSISYELGMPFSLINPDNAKERGWRLSKEIRSKIADGIIDSFVIALDDKIVKIIGGLGGIEIILNSQNNGFCIDNRSFPWYWDSKTETGGYISYNNLLAGRFTVLHSGILYLSYDITSHPEYVGFIKDMISGCWGQIYVHYGIGIKELPIVNAYLMG